MESSKRSIGQGVETERDNTFNAVEKRRSTLLGKCQTVYRDFLQYTWTHEEDLRLAHKNFTFGIDCSRSTVNGTRDGISIFFTY